MQAEEGPRTDTWPAGPAAGTEELPVPALPPRWRVERLIGSGGQADVWLAFDRELSETVVIKLFRAMPGTVARERLRREVRLGRSIQHPRVVRMFELIEAGERMGLAMEWVPGGTVAGLLKAGPVQIGTVVRIAREVLEALEVLHGAGILHRDVKPSNLLLTTEGGVKLGDFGLARQIDVSDDLTASAAMVGTPGFMSPEQLLNREPGPRSDLYSLGATLYQLITGEKPFAGGSSIEAAIRRLTKPVSDPRTLRKECPPWLSRLVLRLLEKEPEDRFAAAAAALEALDRRIPAALPGRRRRMKRLGLSGVAALVAIAASVAGWASWKGRHIVVRAEKDGKVVRGLSGPGIVAWERRFPSPVTQVLEADLFGEGRPAFVVAASSYSLLSSPAQEKSSVWVLDQKGEIVSRAIPDDLVQSWPFPFKRMLEVRADAIDLTGDGRPEVVLACFQNGFYPSALIVFWPDSGRWESVLVHSGWIMKVSPARGARPGLLRFIGVNNLLGMQIVVGELEIPPTSADWQARREVGVLPTLTRSDAPGSVRLAWYTLLGEMSGDDRPVIAQSLPGALSFRFGAHEHVVDEWGNPRPGPNAGRDLTNARRAFLTGIGRLLPAGSVPSPADVVSTSEALRETTSPIQGEAPYRIALDLLEARALSRAGDPGRAFALLQETEATVGSEDVTFRLANLQAVRGELAGARERLERIVFRSEGYRGYDGNQLLLRMLIEERAREAFRASATQFAASGRPGGEPSKLAPLLARARLWWDEMTPADLQARSWLYVPEGDAIACLARWRAGETSADDPDRMKAAVEQYPDGAYEGRLATGAALLGTGRPREALAELEALVDHLEPLSRDDFLNHQVLQLARAARVKALLAAGDRKGARQEAMRLRPGLRPGLLPRILVDEVIAATARRR